MSDVKLLPCPFCGADAFNIDDYPDDIICNTPNCIVNHVVTFGFDTREQAVERWNRRSSPVPQEPARHVWCVRWKEEIGTKDQIWRIITDLFDTELKATEFAEAKAALGITVEPIERLRVFKD